MKKYIIAILVIVVMASCGKERVVKVLETGEKPSLKIPEQYKTGDTVVIYSSRYNGWTLDNNWYVFKGTSAYIGDSVYRIKYMKAVVIK